MDDLRYLITYDGNIDEWNALYKERLAEVMPDAEIITRDPVIAYGKIDPRMECELEKIVQSCGKITIEKENKGYKIL